MIGKSSGSASENLVLFGAKIRCIYLAQWRQIQIITCFEFCATTFKFFLWKNYKFFLSSIYTFSPPNLEDLSCEHREKKNREQTHAAWARDAWHFSL